MRWTDLWYVSLIRVLDSTNLTCHRDLTAAQCSSLRITRLDESNMQYCLCPFPTVKMVAPYKARIDLSTFDHLGLELGPFRGTHTTSIDKRTGR